MWGDKDGYDRVRDSLALDAGRRAMRRWPLLGVRPHVHAEVVFFRGGRVTERERNDEIEFKRDFIARVAARSTGIPVRVSWAAAVPDGRLRVLDAESTGARAG